MLTTRDIARVAHEAEQASLEGNYRSWDSLSDPEQAQRTFEVVQILSGVQRGGTPVFRSVCAQLHSIGERIHREAVAEKITLGRMVVDVPEPEESELERIRRNEEDLQGER